MFDSLVINLVAIYNSLTYLYLRIVLLKKLKHIHFYLKNTVLRQDGWKYSLIKIPLVFENIIGGSWDHYFPDCYTLHKTTLVNF